LPLGWVSLFSLPSIHLTHGRLAQLVRATGLHPVGHRFESCAVHHLPLSFFMRHVISVLVENKFGVLARIAGLFSGRGFNIDTLNVGPTHLKDRSRITVTLNGDEKALEQCINQLDKLIDVIEVNNFVGGEGVGRELVLVKIRTDSKTRSEVTQLCDVFRGKIIDVAPSSLIVEVTGNENKIKAFLSLVESFGISELARTGTVSLRRGMLDD
jgi:acetolactate synthase-1/3 small subunit